MINSAPTAAQSPTNHNTVFSHPSIARDLGIKVIPSIFQRFPAIKLLSCTFISQEHSQNESLLVRQQAGMSRHHPAPHRNGTWTPLTNNTSRATSANPTTPAAPSPTHTSPPSASSTTTSPSSQGWTPSRKSAATRTATRSPSPPRQWATPTSPR